MSTGKHWRAAAGAAGFAFTLFFTGCGGGGDSGTTVVAPASLQGRSYDFSPNTGGQTAVTFTSSTVYTYQHETGAVEQGTYQAARDGTTWSATLISTTGGQQIYNLTFNNESSGSFVLKREGETDRFGPFSARSAAISSGDLSTTTATTSGDSSGTTTNPPGATTTTTPGDGGTTSDPGTTTSGNGSTTSGNVTPSTAYTGFAPVSAAGRTMFGTRTFTSTGPSGQTHTYTFSNGTFHDSDSPEESDGAFTYSANNSSATLNLTYTAPATFAGDKHTMTMTFTAKDRGNFESTYMRGDGTSITINGTFEFEPIP